ncbi:MAG: TAXI family TRAP transporter solute-binding subunit [Candidatus Limnocylindria bacterium]
MIGRSRVPGLLLAVLLVASACQAPRAGSTASATGAPTFEGRSLNVVTGGTGGVYIVYGGGLSDVLSKKLKVAASAQSTPASVDNMKLIRDGKADLAFTLSDTAYDAVNGKGRFAPPEAKVDAKALAVLYTNFMHVVAKDGAGINSMADLRGKRVSMGAAGSGTETKGNRVLEAYGMSADTDIKRERLGVQDSADALRDGKIDAFFWDGGLPTGAVTDLANTVKLRFLDQADGVKKMADKYGPFYFAAKIPKDTYKNDADITVAGVANLLVVPSNFDPKLAAAILQTMFDSQADLVAIHPEAKNLKLETAVEGSPIDYHQGAIDYYKSKGAWKK